MASLDVFNQINNAVLDLQGADYQTYERPLKALGRLLQHPDLQKVNDELTRDVDLDAFLREGEASGGSMVGTQRLPWPEDTREILGLSLLLIQKFAVDPELMLEFAHQFYYSGGKHSASINSVTGQLIIPFARDYKAYVEAKASDAQVTPVLKMPLTNKVFVVHGHDPAPREMVARFLEQIGFAPIILFEQANQGRTVIEKVENAWGCQLRRSPSYPRRSSEGPGRQPSLSRAHAPTSCLSSATFLAGWVATRCARS
jgi:hypothetical protein